MQSDLLASTAAETLVEIVLQNRSHIEYEKIEIKKGYENTVSRKGKRMSGILSGKIEKGKRISLYMKACWQYPKDVSNVILSVYKKGGIIFIETISSVYQVLSYKEPAALN